MDEQIAQIARVFDAWFIEHDGDEVDCAALARAAHGVMAGRIAERDKVIGIAADALDVADDIIAVNLGTDTPKEWDRAMRKVAEARAALAPKARHD